MAFLKRCVRERAIVWTYHVNMRMGSRELSRRVILEAVDTFEVIEAYPDDKYLPSYLARAESGSLVFHVLMAADTANSVAHVVTAYMPDASKWLPDFRERRRSS